MTDKEFKKFLEEQADKTSVKNFSGFVSTKDSNGNSDWKHVRVFDTSKPDITWGMWIAAFILGFILHTVLGII